MTRLAFEPDRRTERVATAEGGPIALDAKELAEMLGVSLRHIRRLDASGRLPVGFRLGRAKRWARREIEEWILVGAPDRREWEALRNAGRGGRRRA